VREAGEGKQPGKQRPSRLSAALKAAQTRNIYSSDPRDIIPKRRLPGKQRPVVPTFQNQPGKQKSRKPAYEGVDVQVRKNAALRTPGPATFPSSQH
jgi:hypothetical protein